MNYAYGLVFRHEDKLWLVTYDESGNVKDDGTNISDSDSIYNELKPNELSFVSAEIDGERFNLRDLKTITIEHADTPAEKILPKLFKDGQFPKIAAEIYKDVLIGEEDDKL
jgi:Neuraminidase (sialidase)